jgi:membrane protein
MTTKHRDADPINTGSRQDADRPWQIPARDWVHIVRRSWEAAKTDNISLVAAGVAFYAFLALFPMLIAAVLIYGLVADPADVQRQVDELGSALPSEAETLLRNQMHAIASTSNSALGTGLVIAVLGALWSSSGGVNGLITAINIAFGETETRGVIRLRGLSLLLTLGAVLFVVIAVVLIAVVPAVADVVGLGALGRLLTEVVRWALLVAAVLMALALLYRIAPNRDAPRLQWASIGSIVATAIWIFASLAFSLYVDNFGNYGKTYGSLAGVVVLMLWLYVSAFIVLLGAEINGEAERQTAKDRVRGGLVPVQGRNAIKADSTAGGAGGRVAGRRR